MTGQAQAYVGHRTGWRYWCVSEDLILKSSDVKEGLGILRSIEWPRCKVLSSQCYRKCDHTSNIGCITCKDGGCPHEGAYCGIHAFLDIDEARSQQALFPGALFGTVKLAGRMFVDKKDSICRAEYAYPQVINGGVCALCKELVPLSNLFIMVSPPKSDDLEYSVFVRELLVSFWKSILFKIEGFESLFFMCGKHADEYNKRSIIRGNILLCQHEL